MTKQNEPEVSSLVVNGVRLRLHEWHSEARSQKDSILLLHATGFHGRCWDQVVANLKGHHVLALDMRGHGQSENTGPYTWEQFHHDVEGVIDALSLTNLIGVGHSMGGWCATLAGVTRPDAFQRLILLDPVILTPGQYANMNRHTKFSLDTHPIAKRRNQWQSWQEMHEHFQGRMPFRKWAPGVLASYCRHALTPDPEKKGYTLACPPRVEASIYMQSGSHSIHDQIGDIKIPVSVIRASPRTETQEVMDFSGSPTWPALADQFPEGRDILLSEFTHFMPMEAPELIANYILNSE